MKNVNTKYKELRNCSKKFKTKDSRFVHYRVKIKKLYQEKSDLELSHKSLTKKQLDRITRVRYFCYKWKIYFVIE